ncbi:MAG: hypothetical protein AVDCRST_MAG13-3470 [uncultured Solirubrobacteraceae bacterium]|uniref:Uncharacterized protein n=1 Tax=uncultured Solirubrobacteraceae bacterium TaxID=1162706 RepID=A0A6J4TGF9_9ACTN|nr:MAG: hypothetical protein AVDCRST_MAG13-3470 [uncultured Solirubrobacteraceae bacterium]
MGHPAAVLLVVTAPTGLAVGLALRLRYAVGHDGDSPLDRRLDIESAAPWFPRSRAQWPGTRRMCWCGREASTRRAGPPRRSGRRRARFHGKARLSPVLLALRVLAHVGVAHRLELRGGGLRVAAGGVRAVRDDGPVLVGQERRSEIGHLRVRDVDGPRQVGLVVVHGAEGLDDDDVAPVDAGAQLVAGDGGGHGPQLPALRPARPRPASSAAIGCGDDPGAAARAVLRRRGAGAPRDPRGGAAPHRPALAQRGDQAARGSARRRPPRPGRPRGDPHAGGRAPAAAGPRAARPRRGGGGRGQRPRARAERAARDRPLPDGPLRPRPGAAGGLRRGGARRDALHPRGHDGGAPARRGPRPPGPRPAVLRAPARARRRGLAPPRRRSGGRPPAGRASARPARLRDARGPRRRARPRRRGRGLRRLQRSRPRRLRGGGARPAHAGRSLSRPRPAGRPRGARRGRVRPRRLSPRAAGVGVRPRRAAARAAVRPRLAGRRPGGADRRGGRSGPGGRRPARRRAHVADRRPRSATLGEPQ